MRRTKVICTIGPASDSADVFEKLCLGGMNVARLNFSHGTHKEHQKRIDMIKSVREKLNLPIAILLDTKGPEYRVGIFRDSSVSLKEGDKFIFCVDNVEGNNERVSVNYKGLAKDLSVGDTILVNDGLVAFEVIQLSDTEITTVVKIGGEISNRKSMSFPNKVLKQIYLSEQDKSDLLFGIKNDVDFVACSFVSTAQDIKDVRDFLDVNGGENIALIAKIENQSGVDNLESIIEYCAGIMVARGDLGVEIPYENLPKIQKDIIALGRRFGRCVITATEMLESMITKPRATRAEVSDVANAVYDGTSAIMLSGETAAGKFPVLAVKTMAQIAEKTEKNISYRKRFKATEYIPMNLTDSVGHGICGLAMDVGAKVIAVCTVSGFTAYLISCFYSDVSILALTTTKKSWYQLALGWNILPHLTMEHSSVEEIINSAKREASDLFHLAKGDIIVTTCGSVTGVAGTTNLLKIDQV
ncbi:MAG: pyruvate kinase [Synergistaceae bacterium]|nr:pyruvate kinase [Synergistaceae bacterium]